jgi:hypothetical protein
MGFVFVAKICVNVYEAMIVIPALLIGLH